MGAAPNPATPVYERPRVVSQKNASPRPRPKWLKWAIASGIAMALLVGWELWRAHVRDAITYESVPVERGSVQARVTATGNLNAVVDVLVSSQVSGNIKALYADWNSKVKKGQLVALIDPQIFQAQVDQAQAVLRSAQASIVTAQAQVEKAKSDLSAAKASKTTAEAVVAKDLANQANAKAQWERAQMLVEEQIMAQQDFDTAQANYEAAQAQVRADQAQIDAANQNILSAEASVLVAQSQLKTAQAAEHQADAALRQAQINLDYTRIMSPVDGTVVARRMDVGQTVASTLNPPTIFEIVQDMTKMQVDTNVDESDVGKVVAGQKATFIVDSYPGTVFHGTVTDIRKAPIVTQNVVTYDVVITVDNSDLKLFPGMTANVTIFGAQTTDTLKVPNAVLRFRPSADVLKKTGLPAVRPDQQQVYVLANGKLRAVPVTFGISDGKYTAVRSDQLQAGDQVVVRATTSESASGSSSNTLRAPGPRI